jgi:hypothetical protein
MTDSGMHVKNATLVYESLLISPYDTLNDIQFELDIKYAYTD